jgi:hypothetical protein
MNGARKEHSTPPRSESSFICRRALANFLGHLDEVSFDGKYFSDDPGQMVPFEKSAAAQNQSTEHFFDKSNIVGWITVYKCACKHQGDFYRIIVGANIQPNDFITNSYSFPEALYKKAEHLIKTQSDNSLNNVVSFTDTPRSYTMTDNNG